jgi:hypothetical protein
VQGLRKTTTNFSMIVTSVEIRTGRLPYRVRISAASLGSLQLISWTQNSLKWPLALHEHVTIVVTGLRKIVTVY